MILSLENLKEILTPLGFYCQHAFGEKFFYFKYMDCNPYFLDYEGEYRTAYIRTIGVFESYEKTIEKSKLIELAMKHIKEQKLKNINKKITMIEQIFGDMK